MKTIKDLEKMKLQSSIPFGNAYELLLMSLEDFYISKLDGVERIKDELKGWDKEAQLYIVDILIKRIDKELMDFDPNDLHGLINKFVILKIAIINNSNNGTLEN